jgi:hypothetical protein
MQRVGDLVLRDPRHGVFEGTHTELDELTATVSFTRSWAERPPWGAMYSERYVGNFRREIEILYQIGEEDSNQKKGPGHMLEILKSQNPGRYDLPSENEIRQEIAKLNRRASLIQNPLPLPPPPLALAAESNAAQLPTPTNQPAVHYTPMPSASQPRKRGRPVQPMTTFIEELIAAESNIAIPDAIRKIRLAFCDTELSDIQLSNRVQKSIRAAKAKIKRRTEENAGSQ